MVFFKIIVSPTARHNYLVSKIGNVNQYNGDLGSYTKTRTTIYNRYSTISYLQIVSDIVY